MTNVLEISNLGGGYNRRKINDAKFFIKRRGS